MFRTSESSLFLCCTTCWTEGGISRTTSTVPCSPSTQTYSIGTRTSPTSGNVSGSIVARAFSSYSSSRPQFFLTQRSLQQLSTNQNSAFFNAWPVIVKKKFKKNFAWGWFEMSENHTPELENASFFILANGLLPAGVLL